MHTAYNLGSLLKLPHAIQSMSSFGDFLVVGTKQGHLLMYLVKFTEPLPGAGSSSETSVEASVQLLKSNTDYKKPIMQIQVEEIGVRQYILVVLCDGIVAVHYISQKESSVPTISAATRIPLPKGSATAFSLDVVRPTTLTGEVTSVIRIAVAVRKKLQFFYWKKEKFHELHGEVSVPYEPRSLAWYKNSVCVGYVGGYSLITLNNNTPEVSSDSSEILALQIKNEKQFVNVTLMKDKRFSLVEEKNTTFIDPEGNPKLNTSIKWSETPAALVQDFPFFIAVMKKWIEVRTDKPEILIQSIDLPDPKIISCHRSGLVFVASSSQVWFLRMVGASMQISQLLIDKQFELAIQLCHLKHDNMNKQSSERIREIRTLLAFDQFCNGKFKESMENFFQLEIDPAHVIGLYSDLLPSEFSNQLKYPSEIPSLQTLGYQDAILSLIEFLTQIRHKLHSLASKKVTTLPIVEGPVIESKAKLLEIIDTTLLKCYLATNSVSLVASLLRLKENHCHLEETDRTLRKKEKFQELIIFYNTRGLHRKALKLLRDQMCVEDSPLKGHQPMIDYLQNLSSEHIDLICEFSSYILDISEQDGLSIFTDDLLEVEQWPRGKILEFLSKKQKCVVPYLEHIISVWKETGQLFHNSLILQYKDIVVKRLQSSCVTVDDQKLIDSTRQKLKILLTNSKMYTAETVLGQFPHNCLFEERAILLGTLGKHTEALAIYLYQLREVDQAFAYAKKHWSDSKNTSKDGKSPSPVWSILYQLLVKPPDSAMMRALNLPKPQSPIKPNLKDARRLLRDQGDGIDLLTVLISTPESVSLDEIAPYLESSMERRVSKVHHSQLRRGLMKSQFLQVQEERIEVESQKVVLTDIDSCPVCLKKFRNQGALVRLPNGRVVHFSCKERAMIVA